MKRSISVFLILSLVFASALSAAKDPTKKLSEAVMGALDVVYGDCCLASSLEEKQVKVRTIIESEFDMTIMIRRAIGRNWNLMKPVEQEQVLELVKQLVVKAYVKGMNGKDRPEITFEDTILVSSKRVEIPSVVVLDNKPIRVLYRMGLIDSDWELFDIVAEDISIVSNYRQQFDDHFRKGNGAELIAKLQDLLQNENLD